MIISCRCQIRWIFWYQLKIGRNISIDPGHDLQKYYSVNNKNVFKTQTIRVLKKIRKPVWYYSNPRTLISYENVYGNENDRINPCQVCSRDKSVPTGLCCLILTEIRPHRDQDKLTDLGFMVYFALNNPFGIVVPCWACFSGSVRYIWNIFFLVALVY